MVVSTASWRVRHTCPEGRHPKYLHGGEDGLSCAGPVSQFPATTISNPNHHQVACRCDGRRAEELAWPSEELQAPEAVEVMQDTEEPRGVEGVGMRPTSSGATRIWNIKGQTFLRLFFLLIPKIGGDDPI